MFIINSQSSISIANVINNWLDYMKSVTIFNFDKINLFAEFLSASHIRVICFCSNIGGSSFCIPLSL
jgi:hypothetical protein